jgi:hypothetical protein
VTDPYNAILTAVEPRDDGSPGPVSGRTLLVKDLVD